MLWVPLAAKLPLQLPDAVHAVALVEVQVSVEAAPLATAVGFAVSATVGNGLTVTLALAVAAPPVPAQVSEKPVLDVRAPVVLLPLVPTEPLQPPDAEHEEALVELQDRVDAAPLATEVGLAANVTVGAGLPGVTGTVGVMPTVVLTDGLVPPVPLQVSENVVAAVNGPVLKLPLEDNAPLQAASAGLALAVQLVALVEFQLSVAAAPLVTTVGFADSDAVGTGDDGGVVAPGVTATGAVAVVLLPSAPTHTNENVVAAVSAAETWLPLTAVDVLHPPAAAQDVAPVELQVSVVAAPLGTVVGAAVRVAVSATDGFVTGSVAVTGLEAGVVVTPTGLPPHAASAAAATKTKMTFTVEHTLLNFGDRSGLRTAAPARTQGYVNGKSP